MPILCLTGLFFLWQHQPQHSGRLGFAWGLGFFGTGISWLYVSLHHYGGMGVATSVTAIALFCAFLALFPALAGWVTRWLGPRPGALSLAAVWVLQEWFRSRIFSGFPWLSLGYSQVPDSWLAGYAPLGGLFLLSFVCAASAALLSRRTSHGWLWLTAIWLGGLVLQQIHWTRPDTPPITVSLLQGNVAQSVKWQPEALTQTLERYEQMVLASHARLIVLPETAFPLLYDEIPPLYLDVLTGSVAQRQGALLVGVPERDRQGHYYNSLFLLDGSQPETYRKHHLVPFGEFIPLQSLTGTLLKLLDVPMADFSSGHLGQTPLRGAGLRIAPDICYEDVFGNEIIHSARRADLLVNVTNDAWFGDTAAPWQHAQMSQARALENGRYMLRATNTGLTAIIAPDGHIVARLPLFLQGSLDGTVRGYTGTTPYQRWGDLPTLALAVLLLAAERWRRKRR